MASALHPRVASAPFEDGAVLHDSRTGRLFVVNPWAASALKALRIGARTDDIVGTVTRHAGIDPITAERDLQAFVDDLRKENLLQSCEPEAPPEIEAPKPPDGRPALETTYRLGERTIRVVCHPEDVARAFDQLASPCALANDAPADTHLTLVQHEGAFVLVENERVIDRVSNARSARWALVRELVGEGRGRPWLALLHASAVLTPRGCLLLCGESGAGKSTLLTGLVHAGFPFVADDIALLERGTGLVWPTPLAISVKENSWPLVSKFFPKLTEAPIVRFGDRTMRHVFPDRADIAADAGQKVAAVLFVHYGENATTVLDPLDTKESLRRLGQGGSILPDTDDGLEEFLQRWQRIPAWQLTYGVLGDAISQLRDLIANQCRHGMAGSNAI